MATNAFVLAREPNLLMHIFDASAPGAMRALCEGHDTGIRIHP